MKSKLSLLVLIAILVLVYWQWLLPGPRVASDFSLVSDSTLKSLLDLPRAWSEKGAEGLGEYTVFTLWSWPVNLILGIFANLGLGFNVLERLAFILPILGIGSFGIWKLCQTINLSNSAKVISTVFYLTNTYIILLIDGGQLSIALAYSFLPLGFLTIQNAISGNLREKITSGLTISVLGFFDIRFTLILFLLSLFYFLYELLFINFKLWSLYLQKILTTGLIVGLIVVGIHAYWLLPLVRVPISSQIYQQLTNISPGEFTNIGNSLLLLSPHWFKNVFGNLTQLKWEFIVIPLFVFIAPILKSKSKAVGFWLLVAIISVFLTKGDNPPFGEAYDWFFKNLVPFQLFRDSTKFFFLTSLSYSVLSGISFDEISRRVKSKNKNNFLFLSAILYLIYLVRPLWQGSMTGAFSPPVMQKDYEQLGQILQKDDQFSRMFWIPSVAPLGYSDTTHPWVEASRLYQKRPFAIGVKGTYEVFNFLRETPFMGQIFDISAIGYIGYPYLDPRRDDIHPDNTKYYQTFSKQISNLAWLIKVDNSPIPLWKVTTHQDKFFITPNIWWVIGSDDIYKEATKSSELNLSKNAFIFADESPQLGKRIDGIPQAKIILNHKTLLDLAASFLSKNNLIFPSQMLKHDPNVTGWWKREASDLINWKDFLKTKYGINNQDFDLGGGWAVAEGNLKLKITHPAFGDKNPEISKSKMLLARVLESTRSGQINFYQSDKLVGQINTKTSGDNIRWFEIGNLIDESDITIKTQGDINVVNVLALLPTDLWQEYKDKAKSYQVRIVDFGKENLEKSPSVSYKQINPTKYIVTIQNLIQPSLLIFSQNFDSNWKLNSESPFPIYSLLNGYYIKKDGEYELNFEPQKYVYSGLIISATAILTALLLLLV